MTSTCPIPRIYASSGPLSTVLHLSELSNRHGTECEHLQRRVSALSRGQWVGSSYASHDGIRQKSLKRDAHDCDQSWSRWWLRGEGNGG